MAATYHRESESIGVRRLLESVYRSTGYDFREFAPGPLGRRIERARRAEAVESLEELDARILGNAGSMERFLFELTVRASPLFDDPGFHRVFRRRVVPVLRTYPFTQIWQIGCGTGEGVYSLAILLEEEGVYDRCRIYATDLSRSAIRRAERGELTPASVARDAERYARAGGTRRLTDYFDVSDGTAALRAPLMRNLVFAQHNVTTDASFNEFQLIVCRNLLADLNAPLRERVQALVHASLVVFGFLALGRRDLSETSFLGSSFEILDGRYGILRRVR